jgi:nucleoside-diphosphate-sugar epimerase
MKTKPTCAITGANGYLGRGLNHYFAQHNWDVLELTRQPALGARAVVFELGAALPTKALDGVTALVHCAYDFRPVRRADIEAVNVGGAERLLQAAQAAGVKRIVVISSISAFEGCRSLYGQAKLKIERLAREAGAVVLRPGLIHSEQPGAMFGKLVAQVRKASLVPLIGGGAQIQYLVHLEDLAAFIQRCAAGQAPDMAQPLTAAHEQPWTFRQLLAEIGRACGRTPKFVPVPWRPVWAAMKLAESCGLSLPFRSDSLLSLMHQNPRPDFRPNAAAGLVCRPFKADALA